MAQSAVSERRRALRRRIKSLPGEITLAATGEFIRSLPDNVSSAGLGILCFEKLESGSVVHLNCGSQTIEFEIRWSISEVFLPDSFGFDNVESMQKKIHRYGLKMISKDIDLLAVFEKHECFE